ncbi:MAG: hypothetical protein U5L06_00695 [Rhodovibrio sp.]|nr:hypothetical protein [Rhodovibrio sp.]
MTDQITDIHEAEQMIRDNRREIGADALAADVRKCFACRKADVDEDGDIWIADPQTGHWLGGDDKLRFVNWNLLR